MRGLGLGCLLALALALSGCTADDSDPGSSEVTAQTPRLPRLDPAWTVDVGTGAGHLPVDILDRRPEGDLTTWTVGDRLVLVGDGRVTAVDTQTGERAWTWAVPSRLGHVCGAGEPNGDGLGGLLFSDGGRCDEVGVLDTASGRLRWHASLGAREALLSPNDQDLVVGDHRVVVPTGCGPTRVYATRSGRPLPDLSAPSTPNLCDVTGVVRDGLAVVLDSSALAAVDTDTGRVLWRRAAKGELTALEGIVSADPLVLDVREDGHRAYRAYDDHGRPGVYLGKEASTEPYLQGLVGGQVVVSYDLTGPLDRTARFYGFDVTTGRQTWTTTPERQFLLGRAGDSLLVVGPSPEDTVALGLADPADPTDQTAVGEVPLEGSWGIDFDLGWTADWFLVQDGSTLDGVLPRRGPRHPDADDAGGRCGLGRRRRDDRPGRGPLREGAPGDAGAAADPAERPAAAGRLSVAGALRPQRPRASRVRGDLRPATQRRGDRRGGGPANPRAVP